MDIRDLMLGDIVRVNKNVCIKKGTIVRVVSVDTTNKLPEKGLEGSVGCVDINVRYNNGGVWAAFLDPIPLTAEIMEIIGLKWLSTEPSGRKTYISLEPPIIATWLKDHWLVSVGPVGSTKMPYVEIGWLNYVHQLQHAFHDCGIDKQIII